MNPNDNRRGGLYAGSAAMLYVCLDVSVRLFDPYLTVWEMVLGRSVFGLVFAVTLARGARLNLWGRQRGLLFLSGCTSMFAITCLTGALVLVPLFDALVLLYLFPAIAALVSPLITGERSSARDWLLIGLAFTGSTLVVWPDNAELSIRVGHLCGLGSAVGMGVTYTLIRRLRAQNNVLSPFFYCCLVGSVICSVPVIWQGHITRLGVMGITGMVVLAVLAMIAHLVTNKALGYLASPKVGVIGMTEVVAGGILGYIAFDEGWSWLKTGGSVLVLGSGVLLSLSGRRIRPCEPMTTQP